MKRVYSFSLIFNTSPAQQKNDQCQSYHTIKEDDREWAYKAAALAEPTSSGGCNDDKTFRPNTWTRFYAERQNNSMMIADGCLSRVSNETSILRYSYCGAVYRGWIMDGHPSIEEG